MLFCLNDVGIYDNDSEEIFETYHFAVLVLIKEKVCEARI